MTRNLLDTNIVSYLADTRSPAHARVISRLSALDDDDSVSISVLTLFELHHWLAHDEARGRRIGTLVSDFGVEPLEVAGAAIFGQLMRALRDRLGRALSARSAVDGMIAATAIAAECVMVSNDGIFATLAAADDRLQLEDWAR